MILHLLGVSGPFPESGGATSGYLLETGNELIQFDLGSGVLSRLTAKTAPEKLSALFISHWHYDHTADLPVLMYRLQALGAVLPVFGPEDPSSDMYRLAASASCFSFTPVKPGSEVSVGEAVIHAGEARHPVPAVGYRVDYGNRVFGYTGDTNTLPSLASFFSGCHLLLADGLFPAAEWSESKPHLSARLAAELAEEAGCGMLVITHLNPVYPPELLLQEARSVRRGSMIAEAGGVLDI